MMELQVPAALWLLPLALLPLLRQRRDTLPLASTAWLPEDRAGRLLSITWRGLAVLAILGIVLALAKPGRSEESIERVGRGAEVSILLDRSSSMDATIRLGAPVPGQEQPPTQSKSEVVRGALIDLLDRRPDNRYALTLFNSAAMRVAPFTDDVAIVRAGLLATAVGRGPADTNMGLALLAAIDAFDDRDYSGSRVILLVSDGGARLSAPVQRRISLGLERNRITLFFIYMQSGPNSPNLTTVGVDADTGVEEIALHRFFEGLGVDYHVYQADDAESMAASIEQIDRRQNLPLSYRERVPRVDYTRAAIGFALGCLACLTLMSALRQVRWA